LICERFRSLPQYADAAVLLVYMHIRDEVRTTDLVTGLLQSEKMIVVPYCVGDELRLFRLTDLADLAKGVMGILEPKQPLRTDAEKLVQPGELDLLAVPGLAFDRKGGRIGHGRGYFDRLLQRIRPDATTVGIAFECQLFEQVPMSAHDVPLDMVVTEAAVYRS
jgi:5-formyltetrahydrofolate cyclo-ligase